MKYEDIYSGSYFDCTDGIRSWKTKKLKFGDAFACVCYAHGISWKSIRKHFKIDKFGKKEDTHYTVQDQINFILENKKRTPKKILEIGGGRGEVTIFLSKMGYEVICIEPCPNATEWFTKTSINYFGEELNYTILNGSVTKFEQDERLNDIDTVIMVESLEHILEEDFNGIYARIKKELKKTNGLFNVTNWIDYHPIPVGWMAPPDQHCRLTDDCLYDSFEEDFEYVYFRYESHISLGYSKVLSDLIL
jgi:SAM-dependent methyltransferase